MVRARRVRLLSIAAAVVLVTGGIALAQFLEDNDRSKRLMAIINYNTDVSQYWEWSGRGFRPFDQTNEAYKLAVNYLIYGLTH